MTAFPITRGEYDSYLTPILSALKQGAGPAEIAALLAGFERDRMGLGFRAAAADDERAHVAQLIEMWLEHSVGYWQDKPSADWRHA